MHRLPWQLALALLLALVVSLHSPAAAQDQADFPGICKLWGVTNTDGSCVQHGMANCGVWHNVPQASTILENTPYGARVRGGSGPSRVEAYAERRQIPIWNITGSGTWDWMKWCAKTGRICAIGCFGRHFQTLLYYEPGAAKPWIVLNNWTKDGPRYEFTEAEFRKHHLASGQWIFVLKAPPPPPPAVYAAWWR